MDKETLSNYGWIVIAVLVLAVMVALATPFGHFIEAGVKSTAQGLFDVNQSAGAIAGLDIPDQTIAKPSEGGNAPQSNAIPIGGTYTLAGGIEQCAMCGFEFSNIPASCDCGAYTNTVRVPITVLSAGDAFPDSVTDGDTYEYGDYKYTYQSNGWNVDINSAVTDRNQMTYGTILESINGEPVTNMFNTFANCTSLEIVPVIPSSVTEMNRTFYKCTSLIDLSDFVIPSGITHMQNTFYGCTALVTAPDFSNCTQLTYITSAFKNCTSLTGTIEIPIACQGQDIGYSNVIYK